MSFSTDSTVWMGVGVVAGSAVTLLLGWLRLRHDSERLRHDQVEGLTTGQRKMLEALWDNQQGQTDMIVELNTQLSRQREYYEGKLEDLRQGYVAEREKDIAVIRDMRRRLTAMERNCTGGCGKKGSNHVS